MTFTFNSLFLSLFTLIFGDYLVSLSCLARVGQCVRWRSMDDEICASNDVLVVDSYIYVYIYIFF